LNAKLCVPVQVDLVFRFLANEFKGWSPGEYAWLLFCEIAIISLSLFWGETAVGIVAATTGIAYTVFAGKGKILCYVFGIVNTPLYAYIAFENKYYGDMALNIYYFAMMAAGIAAWSKNREEDETKGIVKTRLPDKERAVWAGAIVLFTLALWAILAAAGGNRPLCDAMTNTLSIAAMILTVKRCMEQWAMWIAVNVIEVFMWWRTWTTDGNSISVLLMWLLFLVNGIFFLVKWRGNGRKKALE
jgi:nicotinamide mononucleotide transporter